VAQDLAVAGDHRVQVVGEGTELFGGREAVEAAPDDPGGDLLLEALRSGS
jgi:hypothetical protein